MRRLVTFLLVLSAGCSSSNVQNETGSGVSREQACSEISTALCDLFERCFPLGIDAAYGDVATCKSRSIPSCPAALDAPGTSATPASISSCAAAIKSLSCETLATQPPAACVPAPGALADGASCSDDAQCKSTWCAKGDEQLCGKCTKLTSAGDACVTVATKADGTTEKECSRGLTCAKDVCVKASITGEACSDTKPCSLGLACFGGKCVAAGKPGAKCDPEGKTEPACDFAQGAVCNPATKVCQLLGQAKAGEACGFTGGEYKICVAGAKCITKGGASGTCVAPAPDGGKCDLKEGPGCLAPAQCVGGVCKLPDAQSCK